MIECHHHRAAGDEKGRILLVMLPGVGIDAGDFSKHGLVAAVGERGLPADVIAVRPDLDHYLENNVATELHTAVIAPALTEGYTKLWLLGISLGGMGALLYASAYTSRVDGLILLAPFLGTQGTVAEIAAAGGLPTWSSAGSAATTSECQILVWLKALLARSPERPALYLGYGRDDRFSRGHRLLAEHLPKERVVVAEGGHDWPTWAVLWRGILNIHPFATHSGAGR
jgi:pimeloyl-ACP methyl ester carboxylesterase